MRPRTGIVIALTVVAVLATLVVGGLLFIYSGVYNVAASVPHTDLVAWIATTAQEQSTSAHAEDLQVVLPTDPESLQMGHDHYQELCVLCHGAPGVEPTTIGEGQNPEPPDLSQAALQYSPEELYWIIENGIEMTGMPAFGSTHDEKTLLAVTAFVAELPSMSEQAYQAFSRAAQATATTSVTPAATITETGATNTVQVSLVEYEIRMPRQLPAGPIAFEVINDGGVEHNITIQGQGIDRTFDQNLEPGENNSLQVDLEPGEYTIYCPVGNHRARGMELTLTVVESEQMAAAQPTATPEATATVIATATPTATTSVEIYKQSPWWPYLSAHIEDETPPPVAGGPFTLTLVQESGGINWTFPGPRELDPTLFGTEDEPRGAEMPPIVLGVPLEQRQVQEDGTFVTEDPTPFGDNFATTRGTLDLHLVDATATDGAVTRDQISMTAIFEAPQDQGTYRVEVTTAAPHGWFQPTAGGVATNFIHHGVSGWGTRLMPTLFAYAAFWGQGDIYLDDELVDENRLVHGMLTEFARKAPYDLVFDEEVNPDAWHFHLMIPPVTPQGEPDPVNTEFMLPNGQMQPFFHVMFPNVESVHEQEVDRQEAVPGGDGGPETPTEVEAQPQPTATVQPEETAQPAVTSQPARTIEVTAQSYEFIPGSAESIVVEQGETVRFVVESTDIFHTFTVARSQDAAENLFSLELFPDEPPSEIVWTFDAPGDYYLYCKPHEGLGMTGTIRVEE